MPYANPRKSYSVSGADQYVPPTTGAHGNTVSSPSIPRVPRSSLLAANQVWLKGEREPAASTNAVAGKPQDGAHDDTPFFGGTPYLGDGRALKSRPGRPSRIRRRGRRAQRDFPGEYSSGAGKGWGPEHRGHLAPRLRSLPAPASDPDDYGRPVSFNPLPPRHAHDHTKTAHKPTHPTLASPACKASAAFDRTGYAEAVLYTCQRHSAHYHAKIYRKPTPRRDYPDGFGYAAQAKCHKTGASTGFVCDGHGYRSPRDAREAAASKLRAVGGSVP